LWVLDRGTFNHIVKDASMRKREKYEDFLKSVKLFENMEPYEDQLLLMHSFKNNLKLEISLLKKAKKVTNSTLLNKELQLLLRP
jgi:hypothetical protein